MDKFITFAIVTATAVGMMVFFILTAPIWAIWIIMILLSNGKSKKKRERKYGKVDIGSNLVDDDVSRMRNNEVKNVVL